jgi:hypothetical protein
MLMTEVAAGYYHVEKKKKLRSMQFIPQSEFQDLLTSKVISE